MLTAEKEGGSLKCHPYWNTQNLGPLRLKNLSERKVSLLPKKYRSADKNRTSRPNSSEAGRKRATTISESAVPSASPPPPDVPFAIVRKFTLAHSDHPFLPIREITQVHYSSWPDFGAPQSADQLLSLVELSNLMQRQALSSTQSPRSDDPELNQAPRPVLVHCSAGCGRTGTFCTIDSVIDMLKRQRKEVTHGTTPMEGMSAPGGDYLGKGKKPGAVVEGDWVFNSDVDLVEKTVEDFRGQRLSMVQTLRQYVLCYETVLEWIAQETSVSSKHPRPRSGSAGHADMVRRKS
jgi:protein tyrosine phosphatase